MEKLPEIKRIREWQVHTEYYSTAMVYAGRKIPDYFTLLKTGEHVIRARFYDSDQNMGGDRKGYILVKDGVFVGVELIEDIDEYNEMPYPKELIKQKYKIMNPKFHYEYIYQELK